MAYGFEEYDAPVLEPTDLFTTKSGDEIVAQLFHFCDKGGRQIAMRPEMTPSLARMVGSHANAMRKPIKWFNIGEAFRYERPQKGRLRSFYQFNADMFGDNSPYADAEVISLAIATITSFGLTKDDFHVRLSDRKLWALFIESFGIDSDGVINILNVIDKIEREDPDKIVGQIDVIANGNGRDIFEKISEIRKIHSVGNAKEVFTKLTDKSGELEHRICDLEKLVGRLSSIGCSDYVTIDFGIVRGLAYYTGFVFEIFERSGKSRALAGGGRYDDLTKKLGFCELPAVGFAVGDVTLGNVIAEKSLLPAFGKSIDYFIVYSQSTEPVAMKAAKQIREVGKNAEYDIEPTSFSKQLKSAVQVNAAAALIFGEDECRNGKMRIKNMSDGSETVMSQEEFFKSIVCERKR